jgi:hypothetical protein
MIPHEKNSYLAPLHQMREELVVARRAAAAAHLPTVVVTLQLQLEAVDRAIADETASPH